MATTASLARRVRAELGDTARTFVENFTGDGYTGRFQLTQAPVEGDTLIIKVNNVDVSATTRVEESLGILELAEVPTSDAVVSVNGFAFRYFSDNDICYYVDTAFREHARTTTDSNGSKVTISTLPAIDEYPLIILATSLALYTLATDAAFDIDIISPDGVSIPRSERYRQLMEMVSSKQAQYKELCSALGVGLYRVEVFTLRRISRLTNRYVPVYRPQEVDDGSMPQRVTLPIPNYGDVTPITPVINKDLSLYAGDDFEEIIKFDIDISDYTPLSQIRLYPTFPGSQVGPLIIATFNITKFASVEDGAVDSISMTLTGRTTTDFPKIAYYDVQLTDLNGKTKTFVAGKVFTRSQVSTPLGPI